MANGLFDGGDGTMENPYLVSDAADFLNLKNNLSAHYKQVDHIQFNQLTPFETIKGPNNEPFSGYYHGQGFSIDGLNLTASGSDYSSYKLVFHTLTGTFKDVMITGQLSLTNLHGHFISPLGKCRNANVSKILSAMMITGSISNLTPTGIAGVAAGTGVIKECRYLGYAEVTGTGATAGHGIVAGITLGFTEVSKCASSGLILGHSCIVLGIGTCYTDETQAEMGTIYDSFSSLYCMGATVCGITSTKAERCYSTGYLVCSDACYGISIGPAKDCLNLFEGFYYAGQSLDPESMCFLISPNNHTNCCALEEFSLYITN